VTADAEPRIRATDKSRRGRETTRPDPVGHRQARAVGPLSVRAE
jgi:hypothetical protein